MPSTYLIDDKLEFVSRYVYQASEEAQGIGSNSRYFGSADDIGGASNVDVVTPTTVSMQASTTTSAATTPRFKWVLSMRPSTLQTGDANNTTLWAAYRMYF